MPQFTEFFRQYLLDPLQHSHPAWWIAAMIFFPLIVQNYVLGCARVNFLRYLLLTLPIQGAYAIGFVVFGHSLTQSSVWKIVLAVGLMVAIILAVSLLRNRFHAARAGNL